MVTSTDKAMVVGKRDSKTSQSMPSKSGLSSEHFRKFLWGRPGEMGCRQKEEWSEAGPGHGKREASLPPLTLSSHLGTQYSQCCCGEDPGRGARSPRMGTEAALCQGEGQDVLGWGCGQKRGQQLVLGWGGRQGALDSEGEGLSIRGAGVGGGSD